MAKVGRFVIGFGAIAEKPSKVLTRHESLFQSSFSSP
jgi:hypothetical protein